MTFFVVGLISLILITSQSSININNKITEEIKHINRALILLSNKDQTSISFDDNILLRAGFRSNLPESEFSKTKTIGEFDNEVFISEFPNLKFKSNYSYTQYEYLSKRYNNENSSMFKFFSDCEDEKKEFCEVSVIFKKEN